MNENLTELVFILDKSGSMSGLENDTIGGYNAMLEKQKKAQSGSAHVTTVLFSHRIQLLHDRLPLDCVDPMTENDYHAAGSTALLDAVGMTIERIDKIRQAESEENRAGKVIFVITTDGFENSSRKYTYPVLKDLIESRQKELNWEFIFLGANMDAVSEARRIGIHADRSATFLNDRKGVATNYDTVGDTLCKMRRMPGSERMGSEWKNKIEADYKKRSKRN